MSKRYPKCSMLRGRLLIFCSPPCLFPIVVILINVSTCLQLLRPSNYSSLISNHLKSHVGTCSLKKSVSAQLLLSICIATTLVQVTVISILNFWTLASCFSAFNFAWLPSILHRAIRGSFQNVNRIMTCPCLISSSTMGMI